MTRSKAKQKTTEPKAKDGAAEKIELAGERDVLLPLGEDDEKSSVKMNILLQDLIRLQRILRELKGEKAPEKEEELDEQTDNIIKFLKEGKAYELAGLKGVPQPFLSSTGRILTKEAGDIKELSDEDAKAILRKTLFDAFRKDTEDIGSLDVSPYKEFKDIVTRGFSVPPEKALYPFAKDVLFLRSGSADDDELADKIYDQQNGNKVIFNLASQLVTTSTTSSDLRVKAAVSILTGLEDSEIPPNPDEEKPDVKFSHFLVRRADDKKEDTPLWESLSGPEVADFAVGFVFEVCLEKEVSLLLSKPAEPELASAELVPASTSPVPEPTDNDVLFGRGGMTNSHPGNRRFRDVIALHRPDYIRAVKMDKPAVARKIVKSIRYGNPPGRFLKKGEDGSWYDVGDRTAAEKTSQGLRERSNSEKRQRSELRRALRIRKEDLEEDEQKSSKKAKVDKSSSTASAAALTPTLNYVGTNLAVPLSLSMTQVVTSGKKKSEKGKSPMMELNTEGLPPNAVDEEGNILVTDYDILCGRGGLTNHHKGNKRFRDVVALHRPDYVRAPKIQKPSVARVIVRAIRNGDPPGRFLRKDEKTGKWVDVGDKKAAEKTSQALREKSNEERDEKPKPEPGVVGVLLPTPSYLASTAASVMGNILASNVEQETTAPATEGDTSLGKKGKKKEEADAKKKKKKSEKESEEEAEETIHTESV